MVDEKIKAEQLLACTCALLPFTHSCRVSATGGGSGAAHTLPSPSPSRSCCQPVTATPLWTTARSPGYLLKL